MLTVPIGGVIAVIDVIENGEDRGHLVTAQDRRVAITRRTPILPAAIIVLESERIDIKDGGVRGSGIEIGVKGGVILGTKMKTDLLGAIESSSMTSHGVPAEIEATRSAEVGSERRA